MDRFRKSRKKILIIKTDAIGDYVLFRNFIEIIKQSEKYRDYRIDLLGNPLWQDIAFKYDGTFIDHFYFIRQYEFYEAPLKTLLLGWRLFKNNYQLVLQPSSSRLLITDGLAGLSAAEEIIGFKSDTEGIALKYKVTTDKFYTKLLDLPSAIYFEFERTRLFFSVVLDSEITLNSPMISCQNLTKNGIVIFPGAGILKRSWEKDKFFELLKLLTAHTQQPIYLAGGSSETEIGNYLQNLFPESITNLINKTSLNGLIDLISSSRLIISNETSAVHIAAAVITPSICILGGGHFGRFAPYPVNMESKPDCVNEVMECYNCNWNCIYKTADDESYPCISSVSVGAVWNQVLKVL